MAAELIEAKLSKHEENQILQNIFLNKLPTEILEIINALRLVFALPKQNLTSRELIKNYIRTSLANKIMDQNFVKDFRLPAASQDRIKEAVIVSLINTVCDLKYTDKMLMQFYLDWFTVVGEKKLTGTILILIDNKIDALKKILSKEMSTFFVEGISASIDSFWVELKNKYEEATKDQRLQNVFFKWGSIRITYRRLLNLVPAMYILTILSLLLFSDLGVGQSILYPTMAAVGIWLLGCMVMGMREFYNKETEEGLKRILNLELQLYKFRHCQTLRSKEKYSTFELEPLPAQDIMRKRFSEATHVLAISDEAKKSGPKRWRGEVHSAARETEIELATMGTATDAAAVLVDLSTVLGYPAVYDPADHTVDQKSWTSTMFPVRDAKGGATTFVLIDPELEHHPRMKPLDWEKFRNALNGVTLGQMCAIGKLSDPTDQIFSAYEFKMIGTETRLVGACRIIEHQGNNYIIHIFNTRTGKTRTDKLDIPKKFARPIINPPPTRRQLTESASISSSSSSSSDLRRRRVVSSIADTASSIYEGGTYAILPPSSSSSFVVNDQAVELASTERDDSGEMTPLLISSSAASSSSGPLPIAASSPMADSNTVTSSISLH